MGDVMSREYFAKVWELYDRVPEQHIMEARRLIEMWLEDELEYDKLLEGLRRLASKQS